MFDEKDKNTNNQNNENSGNFGENKESSKENINNLEEQNSSLNNEEKRDLPEDIFADVDKMENNNSNFTTEENIKDSKPVKTKRFGKKVIILIIIIILAISALAFLLLKNLPETNNTIYNDVPENSGLNNLVEDDRGNPVIVQDPINIEDDYLLEEEPISNPSNEEEDVIINNNQEVDISVLDSDGDGLTDYQETETWGTDPYNPDTDSDGYNDFDEIKSGHNPLGDGELE